MNANETTHTIETAVWYEDIMNALSAINDTIIKFITALGA
jgi:hypothetical protein